MKKAYLIFIVVIAISLVACSKPEDKTPISNPAQTTESSNKETSIDLETFIKSIKPAEYDITNIIEMDLDNDKVSEVLVSFGLDEDIEADKYYKNYIIEDVDGKYEKIAEIEGSGYTIVDISIIKLEGSEKNFIYCKIVNGAGASGIMLYYIENGKLMLIDKSIPGTGNGEILLEDSDKDGVYLRTDYIPREDIQNHIIISRYKWNGTTFQEIGSEIKYLNDRFEYPTEPEFVIESYIEAVNLGIQDEIQMLTKDNDIATNVLDYFGDPEKYTDRFIFEHEIISRNDNSCIIYTKDFERESGLFFTLEHHESKWKISSITENKP